MLLAHAVAGGDLPAPPWLLAYAGAFAVLLTAVALRSTWLEPRWSAGPADAEPPTDPGAATEPDPTVLGGIGHAVGLALLAGVVYAALAGPDTNAANVAPGAVFVVWWVLLPVACLLAGDVMRAVNPFVPVVAALSSGRARSEHATTAPPWTAAAFLAAFSWFFLAYHAPGSPRALATFLVLYAAAAVAGGLVWGRSWLATGEGFAGLSRAVSLVSLRRRDGAPPGMLAIVVVWLGGTVYDAVTSTELWIDVLADTRGWGRTALNTIGLVWVTAIVAAVVLVLLRAVQRPPSAALLTDLGVALVPLAAAWFVAHDLTFFLFEGQNVYALLSDPIGRGWDLFGTIHHTIDYSLAQGAWVRWVQLALLLVGHLVALVLFHDRALARLGRRTGMRATWAATAAIGLSIVGAALLVIR